MTVRAVLFDFDGLTIDTETPWYEAFAKLYREHGHELALEQYARCIGTTFASFDPYEELITRGVDRSRSELQQMVNDIYKSRMNEITLRPGVREYLDAAKAAGMRIAIVSSSHWSWIEPYLQRFELLSYFDLVMTADKVKHVKPDPELYLNALAELQLETHEAIAFEDSLNGLKAAKQAGIRCVVVPNDVTRAFPFETVGYDGMLNSMTEMSLTQLLEAIEAEVPIVQIRNNLA
ncbi:putative hydrolase of the HAD superfamily [Paenibacillus cellulosilyticus]|uniref:Putative hydrolase of the HAD superfamily n=1 Tax=Paenibacillus cellulosilyticus TaxID=375489 RepID=A0A2V2YEP4_9BACL|nr:HAD family hydrolase [Paenibacillus cellulosilyticus]PWV90965.1 putative hydrolase of the HAD superfamily [Paenibacillus cellulosilyticus]QKS45183.1 HAD family hydrolase [Paenibacillus cellulosilyticus]